MSAGILMLVPTPVGNLEDMTFRGVKALSEADLIAAEDTRGTIKLLNHYEIGTPMTSYHEHNKIKKGAELVRRMSDGKVIALVSDAGMPGISDPGEELIAMAKAVFLSPYKSRKKGKTILDEVRGCCGQISMVISGKKDGIGTQILMPSDNSTDNM